MRRDRWDDICTSYCAQKLVDEHPLIRWCPGQIVRSQERIRSQVHRAAREGNPKRDHEGDREEKLQAMLWLSETKLLTYPEGQACSDSLPGFSGLPSLHNLLVGESGRASCHWDTDLLPLRVTDTEESRTYRFNSFLFSSLSYRATIFLLHTPNCFSMDLSLRV